MAEAIRIRVKLKVNTITLKKGDLFVSIGSKETNIGEIQIVNNSREFKTSFRTYIDYSTFGITQKDIGGIMNEYLVKEIKDEKIFNIIKE